MVVRWTLSDGVDSMTFAINPSEGGDRSYEDNIGFVQTTAPDGRTIIYAGQEKPGEVTWRGVFLSTAQRDTMVLWKRKRRVLTRTNDLGETDEIYIDKLTPTRKRVASRPYKADYDVHAYVIER